MLACQKPKRVKRLPIVVFDDGREVCTATVQGWRIYKGRLYVMEVRQQFRCAICERTEGSKMQFDHQDGRGHSGGRRDDRIEVDGQWKNAALCENCNLAKGSKRYAWLNGKYLPVTKDCIPTLLAS